MSTPAKCETLEGAYLAGFAKNGEALDLACAIDKVLRRIGADDVAARVNWQYVAREVIDVLHAPAPPASEVERVAKIIHKSWCWDDKDDYATPKDIAAARAVLAPVPPASEVKRVRNIIAVEIAKLNAGPLPHGIENAARAVLAPRPLDAEKEREAARSSWLASGPLRPDQLELYENYVAGWLAARGAR